MWERRPSRRRKRLLQPSERAHHQQRRGRGPARIAEPDRDQGQAQGHPQPETPSGLRGGAADHAVTPRAPLTVSGCCEHSYGGFGRTPILPPACWQPEGIFIRSPQDLHSNSTCLAPTAVRRCLRIRTPVPGMAGQSAWMRLGGQPPSKWRTRVPGDPSRAARLIPRIPGAVRLWPKWARASWDTLLGLHDAGGTNEQPSQLRSHPGRTRCDPAR